jgi:tetratricopeptide (TPR) repeat protein
LKDSGVYACIAYLWINKKDYKKSAEFYEKAVRIAPETSAYKFFLAVAYDKALNKAKAIEVLEECVKGTEKIPEAFNYLGYTYAEMGIELARAVELISVAIELVPDNGTYYDSLGWVYFKKGELEKAEKALLKAKALINDDATILEHLGDVYDALGNDEKALENWEASRGYDPGNKDLAEKILIKDEARGVNVP